MATDYTAMIKDMYKNQMDYADKMYDTDKKIAGQQYQGYRNQSSVNATQNQLALREQMASQGLKNSGDNITATTNINNQRAGDIAKYNQEEQNTYDKYAQSIANKKMELQMQQMKDLIAAQQYSDGQAWQQKQWDYNVGRDQVSDNRYSSEWENTLAQQQYEKDKYNQQWGYQVDRDKIGDGRYDQEWTYKKQQDALAQANWEKEFALSKSKAASKSSGGSSGGSYTSSSANNISNVQQGYDQIALGQKEAWVKSNYENIKAAVGKDIAYEILSKAVVDDKSINKNYQDQLNRQKQSYTNAYAER